MKTISVNLKDVYPFLQGGKLDGLVTDYPYDGETDQNWARPAVLVLPGGGYAMTSRREGEPIASAFLGQGFQVFVLWYLTVTDGVRYPEELLEAASAVDYIKQHAKELNVNPDEVFVVGFSAGGHLTGNLAVEHQNVSKKAGVALNCKPAGVGLCYPVISNVHGHFASFENLLNGYSEEEKAALMKTLNLNEAVSEHTPPAFIWATADDQVVPGDNAIRFAQAMSDHERDYELHIYPHGRHGLATGNLDINPEGPELKKARRWVEDCAEFFRMYCVEKF
ncbi:MAG: alpha/beta hydrolase [Clostridia bacterium]|nr:alpha/beta hydrolase [Clostridia bacterium]